MSLDTYVEQKLKVLVMKDAYNFRAPQQATPFLLSSVLN